MLFFCFEGEKKKETISGTKTIFYICMQNVFFYFCFKKYIFKKKKKGFGSKKRNRIETIPEEPVGA